MDSTFLRRLAAAAAAVAAIPAAAYNHEAVVPPVAPGKFAVACSNLEQDEALMARIGGVPEDYWEGHAINGVDHYLTEVLVHPETAFTFLAAVPDVRRVYPRHAGENVPFAGIVCHPTPRSNTDPPYALPGGQGIVPHMQPAGQAPKLISAAEYLSANGIELSPPPPGPARLPTIVYSHGLGGSPIGKGYIDVMVQLAAQGFLVAAVFHGDTRFSPVRVEDLSDFSYFLRNFDRVVEMQLMRPVSLKAMTDALLAHPGYAPGVDESRIGGFGASLGGEAMAHLLGARITQTLGGHCEDTVTDPRIRAAVGFVPYAGQPFLPAFCENQTGAANVDRPYLALSGTADTTAPLVCFRQAMDRFRGSRFLVELPGGQHELRPEDVGDLFTWMVAFFDAYLDVPSAPGAMGRFIKLARVIGGRDENLTVDVHVPFANANGETRAVEFYNTQLRHYFMAAGPSEIAGILAGAAGPGWETTGESFKAWLTLPPDTFTLAAPVCRFYGRVPNSHFFTAEGSECAQVKADRGWFYEGIGFYIQPVGGNGRCPAGLLAVNRAYNRGFARNDANHRFSTSDSTMRDMQARGWAVEGEVMCARP